MIARTKTYRYLKGYLPKLVVEGRVLMHNDVIHGPNWPTGVSGLRAWTSDKLPEGFVPCPCGWAGLPHYALRGHVQSYRDHPAQYQRRVRYLERRWAGEDLSAGPHRWGDPQGSAKA